MISGITDKIKMSQKPINVKTPVTIGISIFLWQLHGPSEGLWTGKSEKIQHLLFLRIHY